MNVMRKFLLGSGGGNAATVNSTGPSSDFKTETKNVVGMKPSPSQHAALSLTHLRKLFSEYANPSVAHALSDTEKEVRVYAMLPLFCRVFGESSPQEISEKFPDVVPFCQHVSRLAVAEIRRRASDQCTVAASSAIAQFLEMVDEEEASNGWMLLTALNVLSSENPGLVEVMTAASIPSTLVKCLYLFFDLPNPVLEPDVGNASATRLSTKERRALLQKVFGKLLIRLSSHPAAAEELARKDDLTLLFSALSSSCPAHNIGWRKIANESLVALTRHGLTPPVLGYIHNKGCLSLCVENMQRATELTPMELVEMFVTVFCLLKESAEVTQTLLDDFRSCQGYAFITEFLLRAENDFTSESQEALRNLIFLMSSLTSCGFNELRPMTATSGSPFQLPGFAVPPPVGKGSSVRNLAAFQVLQNCFIKCNSPVLCSTILDAILNIYQSDNANYFILESQNTLSQFAEKIHLKSDEIQLKYFRLLEFVVFQLNYVPCKELISLSLLLRNHHSVQCSIHCLVTLLSILRHHAIFKDVFREVGLLEILVSCLQRFAGFLKDQAVAAEENRDFTISSSEEQLGFLVMEAISVLLVGNVNNAAIFRESGGARCAHNLVPLSDCRREALGVVQQLILSTGSEDDMGTVLGLLQSSSATHIALKTDILKSLLTCLRESHRCRTMFRKVGGFVYIMSALVAMEMSLSDPCGQQWQSFEAVETLRFFHLVFNTLCVAMRYEPANAKFFQLEICATSLCDTVRLFGCFVPVKTFEDVTAISILDRDLVDQYSAAFHDVFVGGVHSLGQSEAVVDLPKSLTYAAVILRLLYDLSIDAYDKAQVNYLSLVRAPLVPKKSNEFSSHSAMKRPQVGPLNLNPSTSDPYVVHPGVVLTLLQLLPSISYPPNPQAAISLQLFLTDVLRSLLRSERNVQLLCDAGFPGEILRCARSVLIDESHYLNTPMVTILERLACQALEPRDLREFLRMGNPLNCLPTEFGGTGTVSGGVVPLSRLKTLVSMATPRDFCHRGTSTLALPPFVEFDMQPEGFGCLYLPSIAPQSGASNLTGGSGGSASMGGIGGGGDRVFPAQTGMTFSTWICIDKFSDPRIDPHGVRLLTLVRNLLDREENLVCLSAMLSPRDKALLVSTQETVLPKGTSDWEPEVVGDFGVRVWSPDLIQEGQWHHLALVWNRAVLKNSQFSLYVDGQLVHSGKMHYISQNPGGAAANLTVASSVYGYIGTAPSWRRQSRLVWRQGACHLVEDALSAQAIQWIYKLGPHYIGSLQAPELLGLAEPLCSLVAEDRIVFGLNAQAVSPLTLAKIRKVYRKADSRAIAKQLGMSSHENATPIRILHNTAGHLAGPSRTLGGVVVGYLGVRVFCPRPVSTTIHEVGGCNVLLGLVAMATDVESLYAAVKALVCIVKASGNMQREMERCHGYQTLAYLLKQHKELVNNHILHLILSLVGTTDGARDSGNHTLSNLPIRDLLVDLDVWRDAPDDLLRFLLEHLYQTAIESADAKVHLRYMKELNLVARLLFALQDSKLSIGTRNALWNLLGALLCNNPRPVDLVGFGQLMATVLPTTSTYDERDLFLCAANKDPETNQMEESIKMRNDGLSLIFKLLQNGKLANAAFSEELHRNLGFDWLLLFLQPKLHSSSVISALGSLVMMLSLPQLLTKFRENAVNGAWMRTTELVVLGKMGTVFGFQMNSPGPLRLVGRTYSVTEEVLQQQQQQQQQAHVPGFQHLSWLLTHHVQIPDIYYYLIGLMVGQSQPRTSNELEVDTVWNCLFGISRSQGMPQAIAGGRGIPVYCPEAIGILLAMVRVIMNPDPKTDGVLSEAVLNYPNVIIQFLFYVYHNAPDYMAVFMTADILSGIVATLFPWNSGSEVTSEANSPIEDYSTYTLVDHIDSKESLLSTHPTKKSVIDFLRTIIVDSLSLPISNKTPPVIDIILDGCPDCSTHAQQCLFQTELLSTVMEYLVSADIILGDQGVLPIVSGGSWQNLTVNIFYLAGRLVDKLWQGVFHRDGHEVLDFIVQLIAQAKKRGITSATLTLDTIYRCLNRCVLYLLSRPAEAVNQQTSVMETLHKLTTHRNLVLGAGNHDLEFIGCLTYCLLQLTSDMKILTEPSYKTTWHVNPQNPSSVDEVPTGMVQAQNLISLAAKRVWEELYVSKKPAIEEAFKVSIGTTNKAPSLELIRDQIRDPALKLWLNYIDCERRCTYRTTLELPNQIQSKIQRVTGGLTRLASRTKAKREETTVRMRCVSMSWNELSLATHGYLITLKDKKELLCKQYEEAKQHTDKYLYQHWKSIQDELLRERGLWGPTQESRLTRWMLDMTEGPCRMRKKLARNLSFYTHYPYRPALENGDSRSLKYKVANSLDSKTYHELYGGWKPALMAHKETETTSSSSETAKPLIACAQSVNLENSIELAQIADLKILTRPKVDENSVDVDEENDNVAGSENSAVPLSTSDFTEAAEQQPQDSQNLLRLLKENERIGHLFRCARVQGLDTIEGLLLFGKEHLYVVDGFTLTPSREIRDMTNIPSGTYEPIVPPYTTPGYGGNSPTSSTETKAQHVCYTIAYEDVREVHKRRYLLQAIALEIFSNDGHNCLLAFPPNMRNKVYQRLLATSTGLADSASQSVAGQKRNANVEQTAGILSSLMGETSVTQRWVRGELSNFQYLMHLNTLAGRSYNDLMQYPVFPWVLADYDSAELDLTNPATFRDFSKPMGAQTPDRLAQFRKRYKEWDDPHNETGPYHYGTHYSSAMIVCSYLLRLEPFTQHFLHLQGGHFDLADRMFHSVKEGWLSASCHNMADVKELIPEFFYLSEFLTNHNKFDLGLKQSGVALNDVLLPPWAKEDPHEFIRMHRAALECDYVSQHLHEWIDLIFGYKQQGSPAVDAVNVFHPLFYEGNVDIYSIDDPLKKNAVIGFINNFGQIPKQLFKKPHPSKRINRTSVIDLPIPLGQGLIPLTGSSSLSGISQDGKDYVFFHNVDHLSPSLMPVKELKRPVGQIIHMDRSIIAVEENKCLLPPSFTRCVAWGYADHSLRVLPHDSERALMVCETPLHGEVLTCVCPNGKTVVTGSTNSVITVWELGKKQLTIKEHLYGHKEAVTCLAASAGYQLLVSGSRDTSAIIWDLSKLVFVRQLTNHSGPLTAVAINDLTGDIATCAGTWLHLWSINGEPLASVNTLVGQVGRSQHILCVQFSVFNEWDPLNVILTGSTDGVVRMWSLDYVQVPKAEPEQTPEAPVVVDSGFKQAVVPQEKEEEERENEAEGESLDEEDDDDECEEEEEKTVEERRPSLSSLPSVSSLESEAPVAPPRRVQLRKKLSSGQRSNCKSDGLLLSGSIDKPDWPADTKTDPVADRPPLRTSCSDNSLNESFVVVNEADLQEPKAAETSAPVQIKRSRHVLKEGFKWQKQLIFRSKLTMHTAYDRPDNNEPSSVTAIGMSKDHRTVYVGDARGRIHSWSVSDAPGRSMADHWLKDDTVDCCSQCRVRFTLTERRHHCRNCGNVFCSKCSRYESEIRRLRIQKPVRVCQGCYNSLKAANES